MTLLNHACYPITVVGVILICQILVWRWHDSMAGERCWISLLAANWSVRDPSTSLAGVMSTGRRRETLGVIITHSQCKMRAHRLGDECLDQHWNPICNECWLTNFKSVTRVMAARLLVLSHSRFATPVYYFFYNFLLISIVNFHISLSRSVDPPVHLLFRGDIHIMVLSKIVSSGIVPQSYHVTLKIHNVIMVVPRCNPHSDYKTMAFCLC